MKLIDKTRGGSKVTKKYDTAKTPYRRVLASPDVSTQDKQKLKVQYSKLNPAYLKRQITRLQQKLLRLNTVKKSPKKKAAA